MLYDVTPEEHVQLVKPSPNNNIYVRIPHALRSPLPDPVLTNARSRLQKFVKETFWCNQEYYKATLAAIALAKRGENIDRCFIGESAGGTGQSLFSSHLAAVYGHNHAFVDPNLFHNEEEMRKQLEQFALQRKRLQKHTGISNRTSTRSSCPLMTWQVGSPTAS